jgi:hypothetical protein
MVSPNAQGLDKTFAADIVASSPISSRENQRAFNIGQAPLFQAHYERRPPQHAGIERLDMRAGLLLGENTPNSDFRPLLPHDLCRRLDPAFTECFGCFNR